MGKLRSRKKDNRCYLNNRGYTMVELVIVMAIIAAIMGTVFFSITLIFSANAKSTANDIQRAIGDCKVTTMGRSAAYMKLFRGADQNVYTEMYIWNNSESKYKGAGAQKVGPRRVTVEWSTDGVNKTELAAGSIAIFFDRANGGFTTGTAEDGTSYPVYKVIYVEGGSKHYEIRLTELTGKSEVKAVP